MNENKILEIIEYIVNNFEPQVETVEFMIPMVTYNIASIYNPNITNMYLDENKVIFHYKQYRGELHTEFKHCFYGNETYSKLKELALNKRNEIEKNSQNKEFEVLVQAFNNLKGNK